MNMTDEYILRGKVAVPAELLEWAKWFETADMRVAKTTLKDGTWVSTVFLGIDHNFGGGQPLLFETMVFSEKGMGELDLDRYSTWEEAEKGHKKMVKKWGSMK